MPPKVLVGRNAAELTHPDDLAAVRQTAAAPATTGTVVWRRRHRDGSWRWIEGVRTNLLHDPAVRGVVTNYRDITERKRAEETIAAR